MAAPEPDWLRLQKKIFTRYVQQKLRQAGNKTEVKNLFEDLKSTNLLIDFAEALSGKQFAGKKPNAPATQKIQQMNNASIALKYLKESCGVQAQASAENIVDGNEKLVLGMLFQIILKFMKIEDEDGNVGSDVKEALMLWIKNKCAGYNNCNVTDFTKSFHNGLPFCAMIHRMRPKVINYDKLNPADKIANITTALDLGEKYMNVPKYIEASDIEKMDEVGMVVYLTDWYYGVALLQKQDVAARRIGKLIIMTELHDNLKAQYKTGATTLRDWASAKISHLQGPARAFDNTLKGIQSKLHSFNEYKKGEKAQQIGHLLDLESLFQNIAARLQHNNRPAYQPGADLTPEALQTQFTNLEKAELDTSAAYAAELTRQLKLHKQADQFKASAHKVAAYVGERQAYFSKNETIETVEAAEEALEAWQIEHQDLENVRSTRLKDLEKVSAELEKEKFEGMSEIKSVHNDIVSKIDKANSAATAKKGHLDGEHKKQLAINDGLCKDLANAVKDFTDFLTAKKNGLNHPKGTPLAKQLADITALAAENADSKLHAVKAAEDKVNARKIVANPYTNVSHDDCTANWSQFGLTIKKKRELVESQIEEEKKAGVTTEQLQEIKENFTYFDKDKTNNIDKRELRACLQSLGQDATPKDVTQVFETFAPGSTKMTYEQFQAFMIKALGDTNTKEEILTAFKLIAFDAEHVRVDVLSTLINDVSWKEKHVSYLKANAKPKGDGLDYGTWTNEVFAR